MFYLFPVDLDRFGQRVLQVPEMALDTLVFDFVIGKDEGCDLVLDGDAYVSRRHARLRLEDDLVFLDDLGSSNGTLLRIRRPIALEVGDEILVGTSVIRLEQSTR